MSKIKKIGLAGVVLAIVFVVAFNCFNRKEQNKIEEKETKKNECAEMQLFEYPTQIPDINAQSEGLKMICADRTAKYWQVSEEKCYTMQSDGDRNYIVLCNGNTIGGFSLSDGYIAGLVRYKKEFYALRICASEYTDKDTKFEEAVYKWSIGKIDFKNNAFVEIFNASESRSDSQIPDAYDVCVYKDKVILYYQEKIHIWNMTGKKNKAVINTPHLPQGDSDYTVYDNKIFYGIHDENKINLYYFDMQNNMEKKFYSYVSKNAVKNCSVSVKFDDENLYVSNCMVNRQDGTKKQIFNNAVKDGEDVLFSCTNKNIYYLDKEHKVHKINKASLADTIVYKKKASDVQTSKDCLFIKKYDEELEPDYETDYGEIQNWDVPDKCKVVRMSERGGKAVQVGKINENMADCPDVNVNNYFQSVCDASQYSQVVNGNYYYLRMDKTKNKYCVYKNKKKILTFSLGNQERLIAFVRYKNAFYFVKQRDDDWEDLFNVYSATICRISEKSQRPEVCFEWKTRIGFLVTLDEQSSFFNKCFLSGGKFCFVRRNFLYGIRLTDGKLVDFNNVSKGTKKRLGISYKTKAQYSSVLRVKKRMLKSAYIQIRTLYDFSDKYLFYIDKKFNLCRYDMSNQSETVIAKKCVGVACIKGNICVRKYKPNMAYLKCDEDDEAESIYDSGCPIYQMTMDGKGICTLR